MVFVKIGLFVVPGRHDALCAKHVLRYCVIFDLMLLVVLLLFCILFLVVTIDLGEGTELRRRGRFLSLRRRECRGLYVTVRRTERTHRSVHRRFIHLSALTRRNSVRGVGRCLSTAANGVSSCGLRFYRGRTISDIFKCCSAVTRERGVPFRTLISLPTSLSVSRVGLYLIFSGLLRGTVRTDMGATPTHEGVGIRICPRRGCLLLVRIRGAFSNGVRRGGGVFRSSGRSKGKVKVRSIHRVASGGNNTYSFACGSNVFSTGVVLQVWSIVSCAQDVLRGCSGVS